MTKRFRLLLVPAVFMNLLVDSAVYAETLYEAMANAYETNPILVAERAALRVSNEAVSQARAGWRPTITITGTQGLQESRTTLTQTQNLSPRTGSLSVSQPIYSGGKTISETREARATVNSSRAQLRVREQEVLLSAVTAYMDVLRDTAKSQLTSNNENVLRRQLQATKDRFEVGEVTRTDVAQSKARLSNATAAKVAADGDLAASKATYQRVIGHLAQKVVPAPPLPRLPETLHEALSVAFVKNPSLEAARWLEVAASHDVRKNYGDLLPQINLVGELKRTDETATEGISGRTDSLTARITFPLYQAGAAHSKVRQAKETRNQRRIIIETTERQITESTLKAWEALTAAHSQIEAREEQALANGIALEGVRQEAQVGSRTTLDVLDAEQELIDSQVALVIAERDEYVAGFQLLSAIGGLTAVNLKLEVEMHDPDRHLGSVGRRWWGLTPPD